MCRVQYTTVRGGSSTSNLSNYILTEKARYIGFFIRSYGWFDYTEPSPTTSVQGVQGVHGAKCTGSGRFTHIEPHRTFSNYSFTEKARDIEFSYGSSGWFEPSPPTSLQGIGVLGAIKVYSLVR